MTKIGSKSHNRSKKIVPKAGSKTQRKQENRTQGVRSNKVSRPIYKHEPGTLSHLLSEDMNACVPFVTSVWRPGTWGAYIYAYIYGDYFCIYSFTLAVVYII